MAFLKGMFGQRGLPPEERAAIERYLASAEPLLRQLDAEYQQWLQRVGITRGTDMRAINDPKGEHSGIFVWRTIEAERTFTQLETPQRAIRLHDAYVGCLEGRHRAASAIYDALQVADVRPAKAVLEGASQELAQAESLRKQAERLREELERQLR